MSRAVIDQPGIRVFFIGFFLALFLGLALRSQISSSAIKPHLEKAVDRLSMDFKIDFKDVQLKLSTWGLPLPYIQIDQIRISPKKTNCQQSQIYIEQMQLPIKLRSLFTKSGVIDALRATQVELRISDLKDCFQEDSHTSKTWTEEKDKTNVKSINKASTPSMGSILLPKRSSENLKEIHIDQLKLVSAKYPTQPVSARNINIEIFYENSTIKEINLNSQIYAIKDMNSDILFFKGDLISVIKTNQMNQLDTMVQVKGKVLDGDINLFATHSGVNKALHSELKLNRISTKVISNLPFFNDPDIVSILANSPFTLNLEGTGMQRIDEDEFSYQFKNLEVQTNQPILKVSDFKIKQKDQNLTITNFKGNIIGLRLDQLKNFNKLSEISNSVDSFGILNGNFSYESNKLKSKLQIDGTWGGLSFIFSNRGHRDLQTIDQSRFIMTGQDGIYKIRLENLQMNGQNIEGYAKYQSSGDGAEIMAQADLQGPLLSENIWNQLTQVSQSPQINLKWNYQKSFQEKHNLNLTIPNISMSGVELNEVKLELIQTLKNLQSDSLVIMGKIKSALISPAQLQIDPLKKIFSKEHDFSEEAYIASPIQFSLAGSHWKSLNFEVDSNFKSSTTKDRTHSLLLKGQTQPEDFVEGRLELTLWSETPRRFIKKKFTQLSESQITLSPIE